METRRPPPGPAEPDLPSGRTRTAGVLLALGGTVLAASSWLDLGLAEGPGYREALAAGTTFEGGAFLAAGFAFVVAGIVVWGPRVDRHSRLVGLGSVLGAGGVLWLAVSAALAVGREGGRLGDAFEVSLSGGLYLGLGGSVLALLGGVVALLGGRERSARPAPGFEGTDAREPWVRPVPEDVRERPEPRVPEEGTQWAWSEPRDRREPPTGAPWERARDETRARTDEEEDPGPRSEP